jgi:hypothetical protein
MLMRSIAKWLERLAVYAQVATVLGSIPASSDIVESEGQQMKQCLVTFIKRKKQKNPLLSCLFVILWSSYPSKATAL